MIDDLFFSTEGLNNQYYIKHAVSLLKKKLYDCKTLSCPLYVAFCSFRFDEFFSVKCLTSPFILLKEMKTKV